MTTPMFPPRLRVVADGPEPDDPEQAKPIADHDLGPAIRYLAASPARCAALAEQDASRAADLVVPAIALAFMSKTQLDALAAADVEDALRARDAFRQAAFGARAVLEMLQAADARLMCAIAAVVPRGGLATP
jgi:hypothetical protein